jgi:8-amino-7-oxononanoate synthase
MCMLERTAADSFLKERLEERRENGLLRTLVAYDDKIDFCSNDYLGFARLPALREPTHEHMLAGATGSRLISGNSREAVVAERAVAAFHGAEAALIFNSGYVANVGLLSAIAVKGDTFVLDEYVHASIIDGVRLSPAERFRFKHNDLSSLEQKLSVAKGNRFVVVESLYSMDGDEAPLVEIAEICRRHGALLIVDEAHAVGVWGEYGQGLVCKHGLQDQVFACVYTFGKALGLHGAAVTGSATLVDYLVNFARPFIYSTALPPHAYAQITAAYAMLPSADRETLFALIRHFQASATAHPHLHFLPSHTQIQGIVIGDNAKAKALSLHLLAQGFYAKAILSPTVPAGTERLRICLHAYNTAAEIDQLFAAINQFQA